MPELQDIFKNFDRFDMECIFHFRINSGSSCVNGKYFSQHLPMNCPTCRTLGKCTAYCRNLLHAVKLEAFDIDSDVAFLLTNGKVCLIFMRNHSVVNVVKFYHYFQRRQATLSELTQHTGQNTHNAMFAQEKFRAPSAYTSGRKCLYC